MRGLLRRSSSPLVLHRGVLLITLIGSATLVGSCAGQQTRVDTVPMLPQTVAPTAGGATLPTETPPAPAATATVSDQSATRSTPATATWAPTAASGKTLLQTPVEPLGQTSAPSQTSELPDEPPSDPVKSPPFPPSIELEQVLSGLERPVFLTHRLDDDRLLVVEKAGRIRQAEDHTLLEEPFLDLTDRVRSIGSEQGLLSVAFPGEDSCQERFYVYYTGDDGAATVSRFSYIDTGRFIADRDSEELLLRIDQPAANHNGGQLQLGPDGHLYIGTGDGGQGGDP